MGSISAENILRLSTLSLSALSTRVSCICIVLYRSGRAAKLQDKCPSQFSPPPIPDPKLVNIQIRPMQATPLFVGT